MILGAVGTGKTSACMYPYVDQLLRWRAQDPTQKVGGLVLEVKGRLLPSSTSDRARRESGDGLPRNRPGHRGLLQPVAQRSRSVRGRVCHWQSSENLFGKSKEPFWQQAYSDLLKWVILLRRIIDGYTTLAEVYRYIIEDARRLHSPAETR